MSLPRLELPGRARQTAYTPSLNDYRLKTIDGKFPSEEGKEL